MEEFAEYQEHLVKPEEEQLREIEAEERAAAGERVVLDVDLNAEVKLYGFADSGYGRRMEHRKLAGGPKKKKSRKRSPGGDTG
nr:hypothetical protein Itr_chr02CG05110 [Ipomoea trifida]